MQSIQHDKKQVQSIIETVMPKNIFAIDINNPSQKAEVMRFIDTAMRAKQRVTVCIVKHGS